MGDNIWRLCFWNKLILKSIEIYVSLLQAAPVKVDIAPNMRENVWIVYDNNFVNFIWLITNGCPSYPAPFYADLTIKTKNLPYFSFLFLELIGEDNRKDIILDNSTLLPYFIVFSYILQLYNLRKLQMSFNYWVIDYYCRWCDITQYIL